MKKKKFGDISFKRDTVKVHETASIVFAKLVRFSADKT